MRLAHGGYLASPEEEEVYVKSIDIIEEEEAGFGSIGTIEDDEENSLFAIKDYMTELDEFDDSGYSEFDAQDGAKLWIG